MSTSSTQDVYLALRPDGSLLSPAPSAVANDIAQLQTMWKAARTTGKQGETRTFYLDGKVVVAVSTGGKETLHAKGGEKEENRVKELARKNAAIATRTLRAQVQSKHILIDPATSSHSSAVGSTLAAFTWNLKTTSAAKAKLDPVTIDHSEFSGPGLKSESGDNGRMPLNWETGKVYGRAQNLARELMELPANICTPTYFCDRARKEFKDIPNVEVLIHDLEWAKERNMGSFISVGRGSAEPLRFLEVIYKGGVAGSPPLAFVGKGITFDTGGISLKGGAGMKDMRADMGGAATTMSALWAIATLQFPINMILCIPLTENMPSSTATKPGDVVVAANGVTIEVDNTDAEGRLVLADALYHCTSVYKPETIIDAATLTGAICVALGTQFTGVFSNSDELYQELEEASLSENDRIWRMPLDEGYMSQIDGTGMDLCNTGGKLAGSCTAAIFLKRFVDGLIVDGADAPEGSELIRWAHLDIAGVMDLGKSDEGYNLAGMTGRPVRTLVEFARRQAGKE